MSTREVPAGEWPAFLEQFSRDHRAWLATVERFAGAARRVEAVERPLASVAPQMSGGRVVRVAIRFAQDSGSEPDVDVDGPETLRVDESATGAAQALEIDARSGERTRIRFRAAPPLEALDGVAPGEL